MIVTEKKLSTRKKLCPSATGSNTNLTVTSLGLNGSLRCEETGD